MIRLENKGPAPQPIGSLAFYLIAAGITELVADKSYERDQYPFYTLEYVTQGCGYLEVDGKVHSLNTGDVYVLPALRHHRYWPDKPWRKHYFVTQGPLMEHLLESYGLSGRHIFPQAIEVLGFFRTMSRWRTWDKRQQVHTTAALLAHRIVQRLSNLPSAGAGISQAVVRIKALLDGNPEHPPSLEDLAGMVKMSRQHLIRLFKREVGMSPYHYLLHRKMELAKLMLGQWKMPVSETAYRLGFYDPYHFSRSFKRWAGVSPSRFAESAESQTIRI